MWGLPGAPIRHNGTLHVKKNVTQHALGDDSRFMLNRKLQYVMISNIRPHLEPGSACVVVTEKMDLPDDSTQMKWLKFNK